MVPFIIIVKLHGVGKHRAAMYNDSYVSALLYSAPAVPSVVKLQLVIHRQSAFRAVLGSAGSVCWPSVCSVWSVRSVRFVPPLRAFRLIVPKSVQSLLAVIVSKRAFPVVPVFKGQSF